MKIGKKVSETEKKVHHVAIVDFIDTREKKKQFLVTLRLSPLNAVTKLTMNRLQKIS